MRRAFLDLMNKAEHGVTGLGSFSDELAWASDRP